eukprot:gene14494-10362_t
MRCVVDHKHVWKSWSFRFEAKLLLILFQSLSHEVFGGDVHSSSFRKVEFNSEIIKLRTFVQCYLGVRFLKFCNGMIHSPSIS